MWNEDGVTVCRLGGECRPGNKAGRTYEPPDMAAMMCRVARGLVRRANEGDLEALSALADVDAAVGEAIVAAARALHYGPKAYSWMEVGRELGVTRQAAQKRFMDAAQEPDVEIPRQRAS